jgi:choline dehydrogenase-like flavoprotein
VTSHDTPPGSDPVSSGRWRTLDIVDPLTTVRAEQLWKRDTVASPDRVDADSIEADVVIVGSGAGGSSAAWAMRESGARVLVLEMGDWLPHEPANWNAEEVYLKRRYKSDEVWVDDPTGASFHPGLHDFVGGNTKVFGAALPRFRVTDFAAVEHIDGTSPAWPISYNDLEPYYEQAERLYGVHGDESRDPTAPPRSSPLPYPPLGHEPYVARVVDDLQRAGLHPSPVPMGVDRRDGGRCIRCQTCDGYPCQIDAKADAEIAMLRPALAFGQIRLLRGTRAERIETDRGKIVTGLSCLQRGRPLTIRTSRVVLACGSARTALLMQRSTGPGCETGVGNDLDQVGRHYMQHVNTAMTAVDPRRKNDVVFQKTIQVNDWYLRGDGSPFPWGNVQALGKLQWAHLKAARPLIPKKLLGALAARSMEWWVMSEDLPKPEHRVRMRPDGRVGVTWEATNLETHRALIRKFASVMRACGFPLVFHETLGVDTNSHQCGTGRMGEDPTTSVTTPTGAVHGVQGLWLADSSVFVSSAAVNPALTISALALRTVAEGGVLR